MAPSYVIDFTVDWRFGEPQARFHVVRPINAAAKQRSFYGPLTVQQEFPRVTSSGFGSHPCRPVSINYNLIRYCHGRGREFESRRPRHSFQPLAESLVSCVGTKRNHKKITSLFPPLQFEAAPARSLRLRVQYNRADNASAGTLVVISPKFWRAERRDCQSRRRKFEGFCATRDC